MNDFSTKAARDACIAECEQWLDEIRRREEIRRHDEFMAEIGMEIEFLRQARAIRMEAWRDYERQSRVRERPDTYMFIA